MKTFKEFQEQIAPSKGIGPTVRGVDTQIDLRTLDDKKRSVRHLSRMIKKNPEIERMFKVP